MPSKKQYDLVLDEGPDSKIPLHNEDAFQHGIHFHAKYIGTLDVPRPTSRVEIVAAMRRIRYEFKAKAVKKKKVALSVSVEGVKVALQKKSRRKQQQPFWDESRLTLLQHPIYRIFYVSHDSQDLKIFSYIARDSSTNVFRCNVFKAYKKSQAMNIVRTIGQAFEVCHRISLQATAQNEEGNDGGSERSSEEGNQPNALQSTSTLEKPALVSSPSENGTSTSTQSPDDPSKQARLLTTSDALASPVNPASDDNNESVNSFHGVQLLHHQLELQTQQTQLLVSQMQLVKDQLAIEMAARTKAQAQVHQLLVQNRDLLMYVSSAVGRLVQLESSLPEYSPSKVLDPTSVGSIIDPLLFISSPSHLSNLNENSSFLGVNSYPAALKEMSSGNYIKNAIANKECLITEEINSFNVDNDLGQKSADGTDEPNADSVNLQNGLAGKDLLFGSTSPLQNGGSKKDESRATDPVSLTGACRGRLDLGVAPKLDPPPKVNRNSFRVLGQTPVSANGKPTALNSALLAVSADNSDTGQKYADMAEKQCKWEKLNGATDKDLNALLKIHPGDFKNSPKKLLDEISYYDGNGNNYKSLEPLRAPAFAIQGLKGIRNRFVIQHQNSVDSTSKLKLSFSDNE